MEARPSFVLNQVLFPEVTAPRVRLLRSKCREDDFCQTNKINTLVLFLKVSENRM